MNQSYHLLWSLGIFRPQNCHSLNNFSFFGPFSVKPREDVHENPSRSAVSEILWPPVWHQEPWHVQSCLNHLSSPFWCSVWTSADCFDDIYMLKCIELLPLSIFKVSVHDLKIISTGLICLGSSALHHVTWWCTTKAQVFLKYCLSHGWQLFLSHYHLSLRLYLYLSLTLTHTDIWLRLCGFFDYKTLRDWSWFGFLALEERKISQISGLKGTTAACEEILSGKRGIERGRERAVFLKISLLMHWVSDRGDGLAHWDFMSDIPRSLAAKPLERSS